MVLANVYNNVAFDYDPYIWRIGWRSELRAGKGRAVEEIMMVHTLFVFSGF